MANPSVLLSRSVAKAIDLVLVAIAVDAFHRAGLMAGILYVLIADGLFEGRSAGKALLRLQTVRDDGNPCTLKESILRNLTIAVAVLLWYLPVIGWLVSIGVLAVELLVLIGSDEAKRIGDTIAHTTVREFGADKEKN